jgi:hypothetical protein
MASRANCAAGASSRRTAARTTRRPRARWSGSSAPRCALSYPPVSAGRNSKGGSWV